MSYNLYYMTVPHKQGIFETYGFRNVTATGDGRLTVVCMLLLIFANLPAAHAEPPLFPFALNGDSRFNRQLDAMRWHYHGHFGFSYDNFSFDLENRFRSRLHLSDGTARNIQDENDLLLSMQHRLSDAWAMTGEAISYSFTTTNLRQEMGHAGVQYQPHEHIGLTLMGGLMSDRRSEQQDQGLSGILRARSRPIRTGDFMFQPFADVQHARISPREYTTLRVGTGSRYRTDDFFMQSNVTLSSVTRESYQPSSFFNRDLTDIIESIRNDSTMLDLHFRLPVLDAVGLEIDLYTLSNTRYLESRPIAEDPGENIYDTRARRQEIHLRSAADYRFRRNQMILGMNFGYINRGSRLINTSGFTEDQIMRRNEILRNSNFDQTRFELFTQNHFRLSDNNELTVRAQSGIMRYDTPEVNHDDRDELNYMIFLANRHVFSPYFELTLRAGGEATHYVYLSAARSIENNWRRTIRLSPEIVWRPHDRIELSNSFLVRANYTVEDFQLEDRPKNDQSSREYAVRSDVDLMLSDDWLLEINGARSELRIGRLFWDTFQETPTDTLTTYNLEAMIVKQTGQHRIGVGGRFFMRRDYLPRAIITTQVTNEAGIEVPVSRTAPGLQITRQLGPSVDINLRFFSGNTLVVRGWLQRQRTYQTLYTTYPDELADAFRREERQAVHRTYPNMEIRAVFEF